MVKEPDNDKHGSFLPNTNENISLTLLELPEWSEVYSQTKKVRNKDYQLYSDPSYI